MKVGQYAVTHDPYGDWSRYELREYQESSITFNDSDSVLMFIHVRLLVGGVEVTLNGASLSEYDI